MRHRKKPKKLSTNRSQDKASFQSIATALILHEKVKTTKMKAKYVRSIVERLITISKGQNLNARRKLIQYVPKKGAVNKLMEVLGPKYKERPGGYTRVLKLGKRKGDGADIARIELV